MAIGSPLQTIVQAPGGRIRDLTSRHCMDPGGGGVVQVERRTTDAADDPR
jgi:hypothetical protein